MIKTLQPSFLPVLVAFTFSVILPAAFAQESLLVQLRRLLAIQRTVVVAGSRSSASDLCVLSPILVTQNASLTVSGSPAIATSIPLAEVQIWRGKNLLAVKKASSSGPLPTPMIWPAPALQPRDQVVLKLRPYGAGAGEFASISLARPGSVTAPKQAEQLLLANSMEALLVGVLDGDPAKTQSFNSLKTIACAGKLT